MFNLFSAFGGGQAAARQAMLDEERAARGEVGRNVAAGMRGGANPVALARAQQHGQESQIAAMAAQRAQRNMAAQQTDQQNASQAIGTGLSTIGSLIGMGMGGPAGGAAGGMLGNAAGGVVAGGGQAQASAPQAPAAGVAQQNTQGPMTLANWFGGSGNFLMSDERGKENIQPGGRAIDQFMQAGDPAMFQYREGMPEGGQQRAGVMAQDLAQTQVGQTMVRQDPQTGMQGLDQNATISALLASVARLSDRLQAIEGGRG